MRSLSPEQVELIVAAANEDLSQFPAGALEKDVHLTEVLRALQLVETEDLELVFCGGTGLVKAYGYLNRMSEDIDIKVVDQSSTNTSAIRQKMSHLKVEESLNFACIAMEETLAEKALSFLRRSSRLSLNQDGDERLVRHIHDVHILTNMKPDLVAGGAPDFDVALTTFTLLAAELIEVLD